MPIKKRTVYPLCKTVIRDFKWEDDKRIITHQRVEYPPIRETVDGEPEACIDGLWYAADAVDPEKRGGCEYEVYKTDNVAQA